MANIADVGEDDLREMERRYVMRRAEMRPRMAGISVASATS